MLAVSTLRCDITYFLSCYIQCPLEYTSRTILTFQRQVRFLNDV
uniref:Uncharacterized protein n=1 Tax=Anguilla anguilla TaxID=7936 RepID=A0A0E9S7F3_ANGAN